ncbi:hypothetical protein LMTR3_21300 [Bradyrhizobium sp. LMTR 3]|nr:hypothetical protein LMTR3_21300 [Bradyrhizobium sp. LMTR 3]
MLLSIEKRQILHSLANEMLSLRAQFAKSGVLVRAIALTSSSDAGALRATFKDSFGRDDFLNR